MSNNDLAGLADVDFDFGAARTLQNAATSAATSVQDSADTISRTSVTALTDFSGYFADVFRDNVAAAKVDGQNIVTCLQALAQYCGELITAAEDENRRRSHARAWLEEQKSITLGLRGDSAQPSIPDEPMPYPIDETGPSYSVQDVALKARAEPTRGSGGGGTSSANPGNLRSFSSQASSSGLGLGAPLFGGGSNLPGAWSDFLAGCRWGQLTDGGVTAAVDKWFSANAVDAEWIGVVASAFEAAGGTSGTVASVSNVALENALNSAGVSEVRLGIDVSPPTLQGVLPTTGYSNDPVNTATGNFIEPETDLAFEGVASLLSVTRMYNSMDEGIGAFGPGWSSVFDTRLEFSDDATTFVMADGRHLVFPPARSGARRAEYANFWLDEEPAASFPNVRVATEKLLVVRDNQGDWWAFTLSGTWVAQGAGPGTEVDVLRNERGRVTALRHEFGREIHVDYADERVITVRSSDGRSASYEYDYQLHLISVTSDAGTRKYRWNTDGIVDRVTAATGVIECENTYDAKRRVVTQITEFGRTVRFAYLPGRVTAVSDEDGTNSNTWISDRKGRLVGVVDTDERRQSMAYDRHGNLVSVTERDGTVTIHAYDDRGRRVRTVTPEGADLRHRYDDWDRIVETQSGEQAITRYEYANSEDRFPSRVTDPLGGVTRLRWDSGLLREAVDPAGVAMHFAYDEYGGLVSVTDAAGHSTRLTRDVAGRLIESTTPEGHSTRWEYDSGGNVTRRIEADGASWTYEYGPGGKLAAQIDPCGARTEYEYGTHGDLTRVTDPLGRVTEQRFDSHGNPTALSLPGGTEWTLQFDGLSRLRKVTDPEGGEWVQEYDPAGRLASDSDPTGVRREFAYDRAAGVETLRTAFAETVTRFDEFRRPVAVTNPDGGASVTVYDLCGRIVEEVDAEGGLTRYERDAAGRVTRRVSPAGRETRYEYDACGRPSAMIDGLGARTELVYDADSRVISRRLPNGDIATVEYDQMGRVTAERVPGRGVGRYRYDLVGRIVFAQDTRYGLRRFAYDSAGQLVKAINGLGGETRYEYDAQGRVVKITDPAGGVTTREYTVLGQVKSITDPLRRTTTGDYDAAGRLRCQTDPDGKELYWAYDAEGRVRATRATGRKLADSVVDQRSGLEEVTDYTRTDNDEVLHRIARDRLGRITERSHNDETIKWEYDPDGLRLRMHTPNGDEVSYEYDPAGRLTSVRHSAFGEISYTYDPAGNLITAHAGDSAQSWIYRDGWPVTYRKIDRDGVSVTSIERDSDGRIIRLNDPEGAIGYAYDAAEQLIRADTGIVREWEYDTSGRLTWERVADHTIEYVYDRAGQLTQRTTLPEREVTKYSYDGAGRRIRETGPAGDEVYAWDERGWLTSVTKNGVPQKIWVDALGELSQVDDERVSWDTAAAIPSLSAVGNDAVLPVLGVTGAPGNDLRAVGWRPTRSTSNVDPWAVSIAEAAGTPVFRGIELTGHGTPVIAGLEWMGARVYDPAARGFLSVDQLPPVVGSGWAGNLYAYAANDPLQFVDPLGLSPLTDQALFDFQDPMTSWWDDLRSWAGGDDGQSWSFWLSTAGIGLPLLGIAGKHPIAIGAGLILGYLASIGSTAIDCLAAPNSPACIVGTIGISAGPIGSALTRIPKLAASSAESISWVAKIAGWNASAVTWIPAFAAWWERELW